MGGTREPGAKWNESEKDAVISLVRNLRHRMYEQKKQPKKQTFSCREQRLMVTTGEAGGGA